MNELYFVHCNKHSVTVPEVSVKRTFIFAKVVDENYRKV